jgi:hypothetical protein
MLLGTHIRNAGATLCLLLSAVVPAHAQPFAHVGPLEELEGIIAASAFTASAFPAPAALATEARRLFPAELPFAQEQLRFTRVRSAYESRRGEIHRLFASRGVNYPAAEIFMRVFKRERVLELWVRGEGQDRLQLLKSYDICAAAGRPGPKRRQGDNQVPEGFYFIDLFNPVSQYHLSMRLDYPNRRDRANAGGRRLGGDIYIHGDCVSAGCLAVTDGEIAELYWIAVEARSVGQDRIPVHVFPARLTDDEMELLASAFAGRSDLIGFWQTLQPGYEFFERTGRVPDMTVDARGQYRLAGAGF